jgi:hypothetical protein
MLGGIVLMKPCDNFINRDGASCLSLAIIFSGHHNECTDGLPYTSTFRNLLQVLGEIAVPHILTNAQDTARPSSTVSIPVVLA